MIISSGHIHEKDDIVVIGLNNYVNLTELIANKSEEWDENRLVRLYGQVIVNTFRSRSLSIFGGMDKRV